MHRTLAGYILCLACCFAFSATRAADPALVDQLMIDSGMNDQIANYQAVAHAAIAEQRAAGITPDQALNPELAGYFEEQFLALFEPGQLIADTRRHLVEHLDDDTAKQVLVWLHSPLGQRITALEKNAATSAAYQTMSDRAGELAANKANWERVAELEQAMDIIEFATRMTQNMQLAATLSFIATGSQLDQRMLDQIVSELEQSRPAVRKDLGADILLSLLFTYEEVSEPDFESYLAFIRSETGQRYSQTAMNAIETALTRAAHTLGKRLLQGLSQKRA